jgi:hypothetical protein
VHRTLPALVAILGVAACGADRVPPPDGATPDVVARAYLDALVAGDCAATSSLMSSGSDPALGDLCGVGHVTAYRGPDGPGAGTATDVTYGVSLVLRDMPRTSGWPEGDAGVFIRLVRSPGGAWRVAGIQSGP